MATLPQLTLNFNHQITGTRGRFLRLETQEPSPCHFNQKIIFILFVFQINQLHLFIR